MLRGWALVEEGHGEEGIAQLREGYAAHRAIGAQIECSHWLALLAEAYRDTGRPAEGLHQIAEALDHVAQTGIVYYEAELHRLDGQLRLCLDPRDEQRAETSFRCALDIARPQRRRRGNFARRRAWPGCGAITANGSRPATSSRRFTAGSPKASARPI
jgi:predicted ATPase